MTIANKVLAAYLTDKGIMKPSPKTITVPPKAQPIPSEWKTFEGYYYNGSQLTRVALDIEKGTLTVYKVEDSVETPLLAAVYNSGYFYQKDQKYYFTQVDGTCYFIGHFAPFGADFINSEKLETLAQPQRLAMETDTKKWLRRNTKPFEGTSSLSDYIIQSQAIDSLPGYIDFGGIKKIISPTFAGMAIKSARNLSELHLVEKEGQLWARIGGALYTPEDMAVPLPDGGTTQIIRTDGYNQWLKITTDCVLSFEKPRQGRIVLFGPENTVLYDSAMDKGDVLAPAGSLVEMAGVPGDSFRISSR